MADRPLEAVYPVLCIDAIFVPVRDGASIKKRPFYVALGVAMDGRRDVLGLWTTENESAKFWLEIFSELKNRGVEDIFFVCADGLSGIDNAIEAAFQNAVYQTLRRAPDSQRDEVVSAPPSGVAELIATS